LKLIPLNYFNYFTEIEDTFVRRRGKHLLLSPMDWALIESWKERGVPLHVALRGIEHAFDSHEAKQRKRSVKTLLYCEEEVEAQYAEWIESRVGSHDETEESADDGGTVPNSPFPRDVVLAHLARSRDELARLAARVSEDELQAALLRGVQLLGEIESDYAAAARPDARRLEDSLTGIERRLSDALRATVSADVAEQLQSEINKQMRPYRSHMEKAVYQQTVDNLLLKRLREHFGVPRLSLFYL